MMQKLSASNLVNAIYQLDHSSRYQYINPRTKGVIKVVGVDLPEGPVRIKRWDPSKRERESDKKVETISSEMIWRIANAFRPNHPINFDRILGGSYNTRSVLESLMVNTPEFYYCYPGRIERIAGETKIKKGHKHIIWLPDKPHKPGFIEEADTDMVISEIPINDAVYDSLELYDIQNNSDINIDIQRRHAQIQVALYFIGRQLDYKTWIAQNDKGILYQNKRIVEYEGVLPSLRDVKLLSPFDDAIQAALMIDCIWFKNGRLMPAVMEIEHSTGVTSGLSRMKNFKDKVPAFLTRYVIVAPDELRDKVISEASKSQFKDMNVRYFSYSAVEELYVLCEKRKLRGVTEEFLDCFMEPVLKL